MAWFIVKQGHVYLLFTVMTCVDSEVEVSSCFTAVTVLTRPCKDGFWFHKG